MVLCAIYRQLVGGILSFPAAVYEIRYVRKFHQFPLFQLQKDHSQIALGINSYSSFDSSVNPLT